MNVLGINFGTTSGCSVFRNDEIVFAISEERLTRKKSDGRYPVNSISTALDFCNLKSTEIDQILISGNEIPLTYLLLGFPYDFSVDDHLVAMREFWRKKLNNKEHPSFLELFKHKINKDLPLFSEFYDNHQNLFIDHANYSLDQKNNISDFLKNSISSHLNVEKDKISHIEHHSGHAAYALYGSPIRDDGTLIFTADAHGDGLSGTISYFDKSKNKIIRVKEYPTSVFQLGRIYRYTTLFLRMSPDEHEYKVMGLAPYYDGPKIKEVERVFENLQTLDGLEFKFNPSVKNIFDYLEQELDSFRFDHIAAGLQSFTEKILARWIENAMNEFGSDSIVFSGGTSMNVKANMKISEIPKLKKFFVCGGGADLSLCMGSCYVYAESKGIIPKPLKDLYLGTKCDYDENDIVKLANNYKITKYSSPEQIAEKLLEGKVVATSFGRAEMGPRALCNRSIIADPRKKENIDKINRKIKNRDFWMPFAPVIMYEHQNEVIENPKKLDSPYMTLGFNSKNGKERFPAGVHQYDGTSRPLILKKEMNEKMWLVLNQFYKKTSIPVLLNTSFNLHGHPLVNSFQDAIHVFKNSGLDCLWLDEHIIEKFE